MIANQFNDSKNKPVLQMFKFIRKTKEHVYRYRIDYVQNKNVLPKSYKKKTKFSNEM